jgi:hypothetical protein
MIYALAVKSFFGGARKKCRHRSHGANWTTELEAHQWWILLG